MCLHASSFTCKDCQHPKRLAYLPPYKSKKSPLFCIFIWVTSWPRRTDNVNAPGFDEDNRAKNDPSKPRSSNSVSASTPLIEGWNHLQYFIWKKSSFKINSRSFRLQHKQNTDVVWFNEEFQSHFIILMRIFAKQSKTLTQTRRIWLGIRLNIEVGVCACWPPL